ncbi:MAG: hypothetical protein U1F52_05510 [Burkholderiales bacterium]
MKIRIWLVLLLVAIVPLLSTATYVAGYRAAKEQCRDLNDQKATVQRVGEWGAGLRMLDAVRAGRPDAVAQYETWLADQFAGVAIERLAEGSIDRAALVDAVKAANAYRARHPETRIDPAKDPRLSGVLAIRR